MRTSIVLLTILVVITLVACTTANGDNTTKPLTLWNTREDERRAKLIFNKCLDILYIHPMGPRDTRNGVLRCYIKVLEGGYLFDESTLPNYY